MKDIQTQKILDRLIKFREDRGWKKYHTLKNLITALQIEASELAEPLLWRDVKEKTDLTEEEKKETAEEAADVFIYLLLIANKLGLDLDDEVEKKITINEKNTHSKNAQKNSKNTTNFNITELRDHFVCR